MSKWMLMVAPLLALVACEQSSQTLPFDVAASTTKTVTAQGGSVSTAAGAAVHFPDNSLSGSTEVTVTPTIAPTNSAGAPVSQGFQIEPSGLVLNVPAPAEIRFDRKADPARAWLVSVVEVVGSNVTPYANSRVDLRTGVVSTRLTKLGTIYAAIPPQSQIFPVSAEIASSLAPSPALGSAAAASSVIAACGFPGPACTGLTVAGSENILDQVEESAVLYPKVTGGFQFSGPTASGSVEATASLRIKLQSGQTAESITVNATLEPTAATVVTDSGSEIRMTNVRHRISGSSREGSVDEEDIRTLIISRSGTSGSFEIERTFDIRTTGGIQEPATIRLSLPVTVVP